MAVNPVEPLQLAYSCHRSRRLSRRYNSGNSGDSTHPTDNYSAPAACYYNLAGNFSFADSFSLVDSFSPAGSSGLGDSSSLSDSSGLSDSSSLSNSFGLNDYFGLGESYGHYGNFILVDSFGARTNSHWSSRKKTRVAVAVPSSTRSRYGHYSSCCTRC